MKNEYTTSLLSSSLLQVDSITVNWSGFFFLLFCFFYLKMIMHHQLLIGFTV